VANGSCAKSLTIAWRQGPAGPPARGRSARSASWLEDTGSRLISHRHRAVLAAASVWPRQLEACGQASGRAQAWAEGIEPLRWSASSSAGSNFAKRLRVGEQLFRRIWACWRRISSASRGSMLQAVESSAQRQAGLQKAAGQGEANGRRHRGDPRRPTGAE